MDEKWDFEFDEQIFNDDGVSVLATGSREEPVLACGDASGGADTHSPRVRRVGMGFSFIKRRDPVEFGLNGRSPLAGRTQTVCRGKLAVFEYILRRTSGWLIYITDNVAVQRGFESQVYRQPKEAASEVDLWASVGRLMHERGSGVVAVLFMNSHTTRLESLQRSIAQWMWERDQRADELAGRAAR